MRVGYSLLWPNIVYYSLLWSILHHYSLYDSMDVYESLTGVIKKLLAEPQPN